MEIIYNVIELYDGEVNVVSCASFEAAVKIKEQYKNDMVSQGVAYDIMNDTNEYFAAEVHFMKYSIEIREARLRK